MRLEGGRELVKFRRWLAFEEDFELEREEGVEEGRGEDIEREEGVTRDDENEGRGFCLNTFREGVLRIEVVCEANVLYVACLEAAAAKAVDGWER